MTDKILTQSLLKELIHYNPDSGVFTWKHRDRKHFAEHGKFLSWNSKFANEEAGTIDSDGYVQLSIFGISYKAHRLAFFYVYGHFPELTDHENHNRKDNKIKNLRSVNSEGNGKNRGLNSRNKSGVTGVHWDKRKSNWRAEIASNYKNYFLGNFSNLSDAILVRELAEIRFGFHANHGSVIPS